MGYEYIFRRLNPFVLTNLQLSADYYRIAHRPDPKYEFLRAMRDSFGGTTSSVEDLRGATNRTHPFLFLRFDLDADCE